MKIAAKLFVEEKCRRGLEARQNLRAGGFVNPDLRGKQRGEDLAEICATLGAGAPTRDEAVAARAAYDTARTAFLADLGAMIGNGAPDTAG